MSSVNFSPYITCGGRYLITLSFIFKTDLTLAMKIGLLRAQMRKLETIISDW